MFIRKSHLTISLLTFGITLLFLLASLLSYLSTKGSLEKEILHSSLPLLSENIYSEIHQSLSLPLNVSSSMARDSFLMKWVREGEQDSAEIQLFLSNLKEEYGFFSAFFISDQTKAYYYHGGILKHVSQEDDHDVWYYRFVDSAQRIDLDVDSNEAAEGILTIFINHRLEDLDGRFLGVVGVGVRLEEIAGKLQEKKEQYDRNVYLVDENGIIQVHSDLSYVEKVDVNNRPGIRLVAEKLLGENETPVEAVYPSKEGNIFISSRYIPELNWHVFVEQDEKSGLARAKRSLALSLGLTAAAAVLIFLMSSRILKGFEHEMEALAGTDSLTGSANRRELFKQFRVYAYRKQRHGSRFSMILIDLDYFKQINDDYGHLEGDRILKESSAMFHSLIRPTDLLVRWGGDEFLILLNSSLDDAVKKGFQILDAAGAVHYGSGHQEKALSVSIGVAEHEVDESFDELLEKADRALYRSKENGRGRVSVDGD